MKLECKNLTFGYLKKPLLISGASFVIKDKEKALLLAPGDSGKTSILKVLCGLNDLYFGTINYDGKNLKSLALKDLNLSLLLDPPVLFERKTVFDNLLYACKIEEENNKGKRLNRKELKVLKNAKSKEIDEKIATFLPNIDKNCKIYKLSEDNKKLVSLARMSVKKPQMLMIDALDKWPKNKFLTKYLQEKPCLCTASKVANFPVQFDKIFYLSLGKFYEYQSIDELKNDRPDLLACYMFDDLSIVEGKVSLDESGYSLFVLDKKYKFSDKQVVSLENLKMELYDECVVVLVSNENGKHVFELLDNGCVNLYEKLTQEKIF